MNLLNKTEKKIDEKKEKIVKDKTTFLIDERIAEIKGQINGLFPLEVRQKLIDFKIKHPDFVISNDKHDTKIRWCEYMLGKLLNENTRYNFMYKVLEDPNEKRNVIGQYISEYFYDDNQLLNQINLNQLDWLIGYTNRTLENLDLDLRLMDIIYIIDIDDYFERNFSIRAVDEKYLKESEKYKNLIDDIYKNNIDVNIFRNSIRQYLSDNDYQRFHNNITPHKIVKSWTNPDINR